MQRQDQQAQATLDELLRSYPGTTAAFYGQLSLVNLHVEAGRFAEAARVLKTIEPESQEQAYEIAAVQQIVDLEADLSAERGQGRAASPVEPLQQAAAFDERPTETTPSGLEITSYPNPFNPVATIQYALPSDGYVRLSVYDVLGREVATLVDRPQAAGVYHVSFDGASLSSGTYVYRLDAAGQVKTGRLLLLK